MDNSLKWILAVLTVGALVLAVGLSSVVRQYKAYSQTEPVVSSKNDKKSQESISGSQKAGEDEKKCAWLTEDVISRLEMVSERYTVMEKYLSAL